MCGIQFWYCVECQIFRLKYPMGLCISFMGIQPEDNLRIGQGCYFPGPYQFTIHDDRIISVNNNCFCSWYFFFYGSTALVGLGHFFSILISTQLVGLLGWVISPSQGRYLHTGQHKHSINANRHPCLEWDSNPRSSVRASKDNSWLRLCGHCDRPAVDNILEAIMRTLG
jgi:hypothetical protein